MDSSSQKNVPDLLTEVYGYEDGIEVTEKEVAAWTFTHLLTEPLN